MKTDFGVPSKFVAKLRGAQRRVERSNGAGRFAALRARMGGHNARKILLLSDHSEMTSEQQFAPLVRYRQTIAAGLGLLFDFGHVDRIGSLSAADLTGYAAVGLKLSFRTPAATAGALAKNIFGMARKAGVRSLVFDGDDDQCVLWPDVLDVCDAYIKKHRFSSLTEYAKNYAGKSNLTDYVSRKYGISFDNNIIPKTSSLGNSQIRKIVLGWNIALDDKIFDLMRDLGPHAILQDRTIDIGCRASVSPDAWIYGMRNDAVKAINDLGGIYKVHAPNKRVSQQEYYNEMLRAKMVVSPFGYGELCWRDFEAILCGSVLVKQDMSHVETWPNIFVPYETYLPVAWDFSNLGEVCAPYLEEEPARVRIAQAARKKLLEALTAGAFIDRLEQTMRDSGIS